MDPQAIPPAWPPKAESMLVDDAVYEYQAVPLTSIALVTDRVVKIDFDQVASVHSIRKMNEARDVLLGVLNEWLSNGSGVPEVDWKSRLKALEFQEMVRARDELVKRLPRYTCRVCPDFEEHVCVPFFYSMMSFSADVIETVSNTTRREGPASEHRGAQDGHLGSESGAHPRLRAAC